MDRKLISILRKKFDLGCWYTDQEVLEITKNTFTRALVELKIATEFFFIAIIKSLKI